MLGPQKARAWARRPARRGARELEFDTSNVYVLRLTRKSSNNAHTHEMRREQCSTQAKAHCEVRRRFLNKEGE